MRNIPPERREIILDAAARLFAEQGYHVTTVREIARAAGVADGTIYNTFKDKSDILLSLLEGMRARRPATDVADLKDKRQVLRELLRGPLLAVTEKEFVVFRAVMSEVLVNPQLRERYQERTLRPALATALHFCGKPEPMNHMLVHTFTALLLGLIFQRLAGDTFLEERWSEIPDYLLGLLEPLLEISAVGESYPFTQAGQESPA